MMKGRNNCTEGCHKLGFLDSNHRLSDPFLDYNYIRIEHI